MGFDFGNLGGMATMEAKGLEAKQAIAELHAAVENVSFQGGGTGRFGEVEDALNKLKDLLTYLKSVDGVPQAGVASSLAATSQLQNSLSSGSVTNQAQLTQGVSNLLSQYKGSLGPLASML